MIEFTGERVIPGQVDADLWNEHLARYAFAAPFAAGRRVVDAGCGAGYGAAALAPAARTVLGVDASADAIRYAREHYFAPNLGFLPASCAALPLPDASVDLVVALEVIEHLAEWQRFLDEARRVLTPAGRLIVSTPNKEYYAESRRLTGPNPYHVHEFEFEEFSAQLRELFPYVTLFFQNHVEGISFQPLVSSPEVPPEVRAGPGTADPAAAHFFIALCSLEPQPAARAFLYLPGTGNVLRERELHIGRLEAEVATKDRWLDHLRTEKQDLVDMFRAQTAQLERSNRWAEELDDKLHSAQDRVVELQNELQQTISGYQASIAAYELQAAQLTDDLRSAQDRIVALQQELQQSIAAYEAQVAELARENRAKTQWAQELDDKLHSAQDRVVELQNELQQTISGYQASIAAYETQTAQLTDDLRSAQERIVGLQQELQDSNRWAQDLDQRLHSAQDRIVDLQQELQQTTAAYEAQVAELDRENRAKAEWAAGLDAQLHSAQDRIVELQRQLHQTIAGYEAQVAELDRENRAKAEWGAGLDAQLEAKGEELRTCIRLLDTAEKTVVERTAWGLRLEAELKRLETQFEMVRASRWVKLGRSVGLGPELPPV